MRLLHANGDTHQMDSDPHIAEHNSFPELVVAVVAAAAAASSMGHICLCSLKNRTVA